MTIVLGLWKLLRGIGFYSFIAVIVAFVLLISFVTRPFAGDELSGRPHQRTPGEA